MNDIAKPGTRVDPGTAIKGPHHEQAVDPELLASTQFKYEFAQTCAIEARRFAAGSPEYKENMGYAKEFLDAALDASPTNPQFHFQRGLLAAELGEFTSAISSLRNAVIYDPAKAATYMTVLQIGSEEINRASPGTISSSTLKIQSLLASGNYDAAFSAAHTNINGSILSNAAPDLWNVQLMRVAAMHIGAERAYVEVLTHLEKRGLLNAQEPEYLPVGYELTERMREDMRDEVRENGPAPARSGVWKALQTYVNVDPIDRLAVKVGPKANENAS
jgi:tetratricopeptide (TPR) repeat protein